MLNLFAVFLGASCLLSDGCMLKVSRVVITREAHGRNREVGSEGSVDQIDGPINKNVIEGTVG